MHCHPAPKARHDSRSQPHGRGRWRAVAVVAAGIVGAVAFLATTGGGDNTRHARPLLTDLDHIAARLGFEIAQVQITGHRYTTDTDIYQALDLAQTRSQLGLDTNVARRRIEQMAWVKSARVSRILPDAIAIDIVERKPSAVWQMAGKAMLIDAEGRELSAVSASNLGLPLLSGAGAGPAASEILDILAQQPAIAKRLLEAKRIAGRRWTLVLADGPVLLLPAEGAATAVSRLVARAPGVIADPALSAIDLRTAGQMIVRRTTPGAPVNAAATAFAVKFGVPPTLSR